MKTILWLLKREFWEHRGGFLWAPVIAGGLFVLFNLMGIGLLVATGTGPKVTVGMLSLQASLGSMDPQALHAFGLGIDATMMLVAGMVTTATAFVVFFYCLGTLYDDRRDRSVLFWKSLPVSDGATVLGKALSALLVAPLIGLAAGVLTALLTVVVVGVYLALQGQNFFGLLLGAASPIRTVLVMLACLPVAAVWALPTVGWLMLCSAFARSKPFLWAVGLPVGAGILVGWFDLLGSLSVPTAWFWEHVVARLLLGTLPMPWLRGSFELMQAVDTPEQMSALTGLGSAYGSLASPEPWLGAVAGILMLLAAARLRRWRDEG